MPFQKQIDCFSKNMMFWKFLGIYPLKVKWKYYDLYCKVFIFLVIILYDALCTINFYFIPRELDHFIEDMIFYFTQISVMSKALTFMFLREKIARVLNILESDMFQPETESGLKIIKDAKKFNIKYWKIVAVVSYFSSMTHVGSPMIVHLFLKVPLVWPVSSYSFLSDDVKERFKYSIYFYQSFGMHSKMLYNLNVDTFFLGVMVFIIAQLEVLEDQLTSVTNALISNNSANTSRNKITNTELIKKLNKSLIHYDEVTKFCELVQEAFSVTLFVQFSMASCIICICLFRFTLPAPVEYYTFLATYMFVMIIQILVPCWFGTRIMDKSCFLAHAIYRCDWTVHSRSFKNSMKVFVERANRPLSITGWKMFPLSLVTFTSIMNSAYSFFTLLRHMQTRNA